MYTFLFFMICTSVSVQTVLPNGFPTDQELANQLKQMHTNYENKMVPFTEKYHSQEGITKAEVMSLLEGDPRIQRVSQPNGHIHYEQRDFNLHFGFQRGNGNLRPEERDTLYECIQLYMNFLYNHIFHSTPPARPAGVSREEHRNQHGTFTPRNNLQQVTYYKRFVENPNEFHNVMEQEQGTFS